MSSPVGNPKGPRLLIDGREDSQSKALVVISALHLLARQVPICALNVVAATPHVVDVAVSAFAWDTGVDVAFFDETELRVAMEGSDMAIAVRFSSVPAELERECLRANKPMIAVIQFPSLASGGSQVGNRLAAHDTGALARLIAEAIPSRMMA